MTNFVGLSVMDCARDSYHWKSVAVNLLIAGIVAVGFCGFCATVNGQSRNAKLKYKWESGQQHEYEFEVKYEVDGEEMELSGKAAYELHKKNVSKNLSGEDLEVIEEGESTSTAFAITADGYLLTCAHCVRGAKTIDINVGDEKKRAKVIEADYEQDLALLKIEAKDLPFVTLGKEQKVELAQDVRAIGYPLSTVLGNSVKVTRGSIAGFIDDGIAAETMQIDVAVNPGNSGGPLVDETGAVVGVVNAKLSGERVAKVGFAIPIKLACEMLDRNKVKYEAKKMDQVLEGPELAKKLIPSVFFVEAEIGPGGENSFSNFRFSTKGSLSRPSSRGNQRETIRSDAIIGKEGELLDSDGRVGLPLLLGTVAEMPFEYLPAHSQKTWSQGGMFTLPLPKSAGRQRRNDPFDPFGAFPGFGGPRLPRGFGGPFGPRFGGGFGGFGGFGSPREEAPEMRIALGRSTTVYKVHKQEGDLVTIFKKFSLTTVEDKDEFANLKMKHDTTLVFDVKAGMFVSQKLDGSVKIKMGDKIVDFPIEMTYKKIGFKDYSSPEKGQDEDVVVAAENTKKPMPKIGLTKEQVDEFIGDSEELEESVLLAYLNRLSQWNGAAERKPEIASALGELAVSDKPGVKKLAVDALLKWDPEAATPLVIEGFQKASAFSKRTWFAKLGRTGSADAAVILVKELGNPGSLRYAKAALVAIGASAEPAVGDALKDNSGDVEIANTCLEVLGNIGTEQSVGLINSLLQQVDWKSKTLAESVLKKIKSRK